MMNFLEKYKKTKLLIIAFLLAAITISFTVKPDPDPESDFLCNRILMPFQNIN